MGETVRSLRRLFRGFAGLLGAGAFVLLVDHGRGEDRPLTLVIAGCWLWMANLSGLLVHRPYLVIGACALSAVVQALSAVELS